MAYSKKKETKPNNIHIAFVAKGLFAGPNVHRFPSFLEFFLVHDFGEN